MVSILGSVQYYQRMKSVLESNAVDIVYHAAAYKHVTIIEENPIEGVKNNINGTHKMAQAAIDAGVKRFVLISTDKAVRTTNVMGATKRCAEMILQALDATVTHEEVTRFFMTIPEAAQLVIQAGAMARGGEVFVLDMGEPVKILNLARRMILLSGLTIREPNNPDGDIAIEIVGLKPGEKLYEELLIGDNPTDHPMIIHVKENMLPMERILGTMADLELAADRQDNAAIRKILMQTVEQ